MIDEKQRETNTLRHCITQVNTKEFNFEYDSSWFGWLIVYRWCQRGSNNKALEKGRTWFRNIAWSLLVEFMKMKTINGRKKREDFNGILGWFIVFWFLLLKHRGNTGENAIRGVRLLHFWGIRVSRVSEYW